MSIIDTITKLLSSKKEYPVDEQKILEGFARAAGNLQKIDEMKNTEGWQLLEGKVREEIRARITEKIKDDQYIQSLLNLLLLSDSKSQWRELDEEISRLLPE